MKKSLTLYAIIGIIISEVRGIKKNLLLKKKKDDDKMIKYIEEVKEMDNLIFEEKIYDYEFVEYVRDLHIKYIDQNFDLTIDEMVEKFEDEDEDKKVFANLYNLEYGRINDLEYLGLASVEFAREYLEVIQMLPQKP